MQYINNQILMYVAKRLSNFKWTGINLLKKSYFPFSEGALSKGQSNQTLQDWQYSKSIRHELKNNNISEALSLIFQSYLNDKVLDIQIYNSVYQKINQLSLQLSYAEILYQIYREHFPPNNLLSNWMSKLTASTNTVLLQKLKKDYEAIKMPYPSKTIRNSRKQSKRQQKNIQFPQIKEQQSSRKKGRYKKTQLSQSIQPVPSDLIPKIQLRNVDNTKLYESEGFKEEDLKQRFAAQIKQIIQHIGYGMGANNYSKVSIHDIQIMMNVPSDTNQQHTNDQDDYEQYEDEEESIGLYGWDISKIKIGRIQLYNDKKNKDDQ